MSRNVIAASESFEHGASLTGAFGLFPDIFRAQTLLSPAIDAEAGLVKAILAREGRLSQDQKLSILLRVSKLYGNEYFRVLHDSARQGPSSDDPVLLGFIAKLAKHSAWVSANDVTALRKCGLDDELILETIATIALAQMFCTLAKGLISSAVLSACPALPDPSDWVEPAGPYLGSSANARERSQSLTFLGEEYGFVPNLYLAQGLRADFVDAETNALQRIMLQDNGLTRIQKEYTLLAVSATNLNTYCVTMGGQVLSILGGATLEECDQIIQDHHQSNMSTQDKTLLDETRKLAALSRRSSDRFEAERLRAHGFTEVQIIEAVGVATQLELEARNGESCNIKTPSTCKLRADAYGTKRRSFIFRGRKYQPDMNA